MTVVSSRLAAVDAGCATAPAGGRGGSRRVPVGAGSGQPAGAGSDEHLPHCGGDNQIVDRSWFR